MDAIVPQRGGWPRCLRGGVQRHPRQRSVQFVSVPCRRHGVCEDGGQRAGQGTLRGGAAAEGLMARWWHGCLQGLYGPPSLSMD